MVKTLIGFQELAIGPLIESLADKNESIKYYSAESIVKISQQHIKLAKVVREKLLITLEGENENLKPKGNEVLLMLEQSKSKNN